MVPKCGGPEREDSIMAQYFAISEADIVGSMESLPFPPNAAAVPGSPNAFFIRFAPFSDYFTVNTNPDFVVPTATLTSFTQFESPTPLAIGAGAAKGAWKADSGDSYLLGAASTPSNDTYFGLAFSAKVGDPTKTHGTEQQINQFWFKFEDKIHGSGEEDKLCGWAEDDMMWGGEDEDEFYYGKGMGKDKVMDFEYKKDTLVLDDSVAEKFKGLKGDVKFKKNGSAIINAGSGDKVIVYGIDNTKELRKSISYDDFTDFA